MNILVLSWRGIGHPKAGGAEIVVMEHAKAWAKAGNNVTIFTSSYDGGVSKEKIEGVEFIRQGGEIISVHIKAFLWFLFGVHPKFDIVIDHFHGIPFFTPLYVKVKKIVNIHEIAGEVWFVNFNFFIALIGYILEPLIIKIIYRNIPFMTGSNSTKQALIDVGINEARINVINHGVTIINLKKRVTKFKEFSFIFLGNITKDKGVEDIIEAYNIFVSRINEKHQLRIVGKGEKNYVDYLRDKVRKLRLEDQIKFDGFVNESKKFELLKRSCILLHASVKEEWGLVVIEAAAMGTPTIGYNIPGLQDSVKNNITGLLCKKNTPEGMAEMMVEVYQNKELYIRLGTASVQWSKTFSWKNSANKSLRLLKDILVS